jgi:hypothetical protein
MALSQILDDDLDNFNNLKEQKANGINTRNWH